MSRALDFIQNFDIKHSQFHVVCDEDNSVNLIYKIITKRHKSNINHEKQNTNFNTNKLLIRRIDFEKLRCYSKWMNHYVKSSIHVCSITL